jgi:phosphatidylglycerophosphatase C
LNDVKLALFDFDETLIKENSLANLFKEVTGKKFLFPYALSLVLQPSTYRKGVKWSIKRRLYKCCLSGVTEKELFSAGRTVAERLNPITNVTEKLHELYANDYKIWIITATPTLFVKGIITEWQWPIDKVIGTELYQNNQVYTGELDKECMQEEKVKRIQKTIEEEGLNFSIEVSYGNLPVDIPMMLLALKSYAVKNEKIFIFS